MINNQFNSLLKRVRETLQSGHSVAVVGWRDSNHNKFTRQLLRDKKKKVIFLSASSTRLPEKVALVLFTWFIYHSESTRLKKGKLYHPIPIEIGLIKKILESCADLLISSPSSSVVNGAEKPMAVESPATLISINELSYEVLDFLTTPKEKYEMSNTEKFVKAFLAEAEANRTNPEHVGKTVLANLRRDYSVEETVPQLVRAGWIIGEVGIGKKKTGSYKAGRKMLDTAAQINSEPEDPYELAKYLVSKKPEVLAQKAEIEKELTRIEAAGKVLAALAELK